MFKILLFILIALMPVGSFAATEISTPGTNLGIGTTDVANSLGIQSGLAIGGHSYTNVTAPAGGAIIQGNVGVGSPNPGSVLDVQGTVRLLGVGNVGIDSINPGVALDVQGSLRILGGSSGGAGIALDVQGTIRGTSFFGVSNTTFVVCSSTANPNWKCDYKAGTTNAQTQINLAITAANAISGGGHVELTEGTFNIGANNTPVIPLSNVWLQGSGMYGTTILVGNLALGNTQIGVVWNIASQVNNFRVSDLKIDGTAMRGATWNVSQKGIEITGGAISLVDDKIKVDHVWVYNTPATCIATDGDTNMVVTDNLMDTCGTTGNPGGVWSNGLGIGNNGFGYGTTGTGINENVVVSDNICLNVADACILFEEQGGTTVASWGYTVTGNIDSGGNNVVRFSGNSGGTIAGNFGYNETGSCIIATTDSAAQVNFKDIAITGNTCMSPTLDGIDVFPSTATSGINITVTGNTIDTPGQFGMDIRSTDTIINGNIVNSANQDALRYLTGINTGNVKIIGNQFINSGTSSTATHQSGINIKVNSGKTLAGLDIENNLITGSTGYALDTELSAGAITNFSLKNNDMSGNTLGVTLLTGVSPAITAGTNFFPFGNRAYTTNNVLEGVLNVTGNEGIGSLNPGRTLDVQGSIRVITSQTGTPVLDVQGTLTRFKDTTGGTCTCCTTQSGSQTCGACSCLI